MISAYLDIGTNTFELLVVEHNSRQQFEFIGQRLLPVFLGRGSYQDNSAQKDRLEIALAALDECLEYAKLNGAASLQAYGTSASRDYQLSKHFEQIKGVEFKVISGNKEALIVKDAIKTITSHLAGPKLIMDIGGGSVELTSLNTEEQSVSLDIGVTRLQEKLNIGPQMNPNSLQDLHSYLLEKSTQLNAQKTKHLIGCSGSMETFFDLLDKEVTRSKTLKSIPSAVAVPVLEKWIFSSEKEREANNRIPDFRKTLIPIGMSIILFYIQHFKIEWIHYSKYGLKEAMFFEDIKHYYGEDSSH